MKFDKLSLFADNATIPAAANSTVYGRVVDFRKNNLVDGCLKVYAQTVGTVNSSGAITTTLQVSDNATSWTDLATFAQNGMVLAAAFLPILGKKRFARLKFAVGSTSLSGAVTVKAGLVDQFDIDEIPSIQTYPPLEDVSAAGDGLGERLTLAASSGTITKGSSGTVQILSGVVTEIDKPGTYTVTVSGGTITIALQAAATDGTVKLVDGLGNVVEYAVTAASV